MLLLHNFQHFFYVARHLHAFYEFRSFHFFRSFYACYALRDPSDSTNPSRLFYSMPQKKFWNFVADAIDFYTFCFRNQRYFFLFQIEYEVVEFFRFSKNAFEVRHSQAQKTDRPAHEADHPLLGSGRQGRLAH